MENTLRTKKAVQFGTEEHVETFSVDSLKDYPSIWWSRKEVREIEEESETLLHFMNINMINHPDKDGNQYPTEIDPSIHSIRGLEKRTEVGAWEVYEIQRDARNAVLNQQDNYRKKKSLSASRNSCGTKVARSTSSSFEEYHQQQMQEMQEAIANVYQMATLNARRVAYEIGLKDQLEAKLCLLEVDHNITTVSDGITQQPPPPPQKETSPIATPAVRQSSGTITLAPEPMRTINNSVSQHLTNPLPVIKSNNDSVKSDPVVIGSSSPMQETDPTVKITLYGKNLDRIGTAPKPRIGLSPLKKRRPKVSPNNSEVTTDKLVTPLVLSSEVHPDESKLAVATTMRKSLDEFLIELEKFHEENVLSMDLTVNALVIPTRRKKTIRKKKVDDSVVLDENVLKMLQDNVTVAITKQKIKKKKKKPRPSVSSSDEMNSGSGSEHNNTKQQRPKRKSPKRTTSRDSSKGNCTADTEMMFDTSTSTLDDSLALEDFQTTNHDSDHNLEYRLYESCTSCYNDDTIPLSKTVASSFQDSFITI